MPIFMRAKHKPKLLFRIHALIYFSVKKRVYQLNITKNIVSRPQFYTHPMFYTRHGQSAALGPVLLLGKANNISQFKQNLYLILPNKHQND